MLTVKVTGPIYRRTLRTRLVFSLKFKGGRRIACKSQHCIWFFFFFFFFLLLAIILLIAATPSDIHVYMKFLKILHSHGQLPPLLSNMILYIYKYLTSIECSSHHPIHIYIYIYIYIYIILSY
jgi:hypothetical protein